MEEYSMNQAFFNEFLELLARVVEATAKDPADAARIIRESKS